MGADCGDYQAFELPLPPHHSSREGGVWGRGRPSLRIICLLFLGCSVTISKAGLAGVEVGGGL